MATTEEEVSSQVKRSTRRVSEAKAGLKIDTSKLDGLNKQFKQMRDTLADIKKQLDAVAKSGNNAANALGGVGGQGGPARAQNGMPQFKNSSLPATPATAVGGGGIGGRISSLLGTGGGGISPLAQAALAGGAAVGIGQFMGSAVGALDARIDRGMDYATSADKMSLLYQQMTGMSRLAVQSQYRQPLMDYRLGAGGANELLALQSRSQADAANLAPAIEAMRTQSGFSLTTGDALSQIESLMQPQVANQMMRTLGTNIYNFGGGMRDPRELFNQLIDRFALNSEERIEGARGIGSITRARMTQAGISTDLQDLLFQQASSQLAFERRGGEGNYDPSKESHRRLMGVEDNFATQQEETTRLRQAREERFYREQADNFADLEKQTQRLTNAFAGLEDALGGAIGARTSNRGFMKISGRLMQLGGMAAIGLAPFTGGTSLAIAGGVSAIAGSTLSGDPGESPTSSASGAQSGPPSRSDNTRDASITVPHGYGNSRISLTELRSKASFQKLNTKMQNRLLDMMRANPNVGLGEGWRDPATQERMFLQRYRKTDKDTGIFWNGSYWERVSGAPAAPPGRSMHEIGLAADLVGDLDWVQKNAARFGLKTFAQVNNEPWHVQPSELPNSRREYEAGGAAWGTNGTYDETAKFEDGGGMAGSPSLDVSGEHGSGGSGYRSVGPVSYAGMSISQILDSIQGNLSIFGRSSGGSRTSRSERPRSSASTSVAGAAAGGALSGQQIAQLLFDAGFRGQDLVNMVAIGKRESGWRPNAYNGNLRTGDQSYGLFQINTLNGPGGQMGDLVKGILQDMGLSGDFQDLFKPDVNARVAYEFYRRNGNTLRPWGGYKGMANTYNTNVAEATQIVTDAGLMNRGDPMPMGGPIPMSGPVSMSNYAPSFTIAPTINFHGTPASNDLRHIAEEVGSLLEEQARKVEMRSS